MRVQMYPGMTAFIADESCHIPITDNTANSLVIVAREALEDMTSPPRATLARILEFTATFGLWPP